MTRWYSKPWGMVRRTNCTMAFAAGAGHDGDRVYRLNTPQHQPGAYRHHRCNLQLRSGWDRVTKSAEWMIPNRSVRFWLKADIRRSRPRSALTHLRLHISRGPAAVRGLGDQRFAAEER